MMIFFRLISRVFGLLDFILWTQVTIIVTCASFYVINQIKYRFTIYIVGTWALLIVILYICYLYIVASIGLIKATSSKPRDSNARIKWCRVWLNLSWTSFAVGAVLLLFFCQYNDPQRNIEELIVLIVNILLRGMSLFCVNAYIRELNTVIRQPHYISETMTPLAVSGLYTVSEPNETRIMFNSPKSSSQEGLPTYEDVMLKEAYDDSSPPPYDAATAGERH